MGIGRYFSRGAKSTFCLSFSGCWRYNANGRSQNSLPFQHHKEHAPCYGNSPKICASSAAMLLFHSSFFSYRIKLRGSLLSAVIVSLHYLLSCHRRLRSTVTCDKTPTIVTFFKSEPLLPCDCYAIMTNSRTIRSEVLQPDCAGSGADLVNCKLITAWHQNSEPDSCAVWLSYRQIKLPLQELSQLSSWFQVSRNF